MSDTKQPTPDVITDSLGRKLTLRRLGVADQMKLLRAIGPDQSLNRPYVELVECLFLVSAIDGNPTILPFNERQIDAAAEKLGDEGAAAVIEYRYKAIQEMQSAAEAAIAAGDTPRADPFAKPEPSPSTALSSNS